MGATKLSRPHVILVHGLWTNRFIIWPLAWRLWRAGYRVHFFSYFSTLHAYDAHPSALLKYLERFSTGPVFLIGHSMGGVVILSALERCPTEMRARIGAIVMLGAPLRGSEAGLQFMRHALGRFAVGSSAGLWQTFPVLRVSDAIRVGLIAGTRRAGLGRFFARLEELNDGVVTVEETRLPGLADHLVLPVSHTGMLFSKDVARQSMAFLRDGRFVR